MKMREEDKKGTIYARDFNCTRCASAGKHTKAEVFVGLNDPDSKQYPMCRNHADEWRMEVLINIPKFEPPSTRMREEEK